MTELRDAVQGFQRRKQPRTEVLRGWMVDHERIGSARVTAEPGKVYVRLERGGGGDVSGELIVAHARIRPVPGWPVFVGTTVYRDWEYTILEVDTEAIGGLLDGAPMLEHHALTHEWATPSGSDDVVYPKFLQLYDFSVWPDPSGTSVNVLRGIYRPSGTVLEWDQDNVDLAAWVPAWGSRYVLVCLTPTGTIELVPGALQSFLTLADIPEEPSTDHWALAAVRLRAGDTTIVQTPSNQNIEDLRFSRLGFLRGAGGGVTDHGALTGLGDDDHTQYLLDDATEIFTAQQIVETDVIVFDLDLQGTDYDTDAELEAAGLKLFDRSPTQYPFPDALTATQSGTWAHVAGKGWEATPGAASQGVGIIVPLVRPGDWALELTIDFQDATASNVSYVRLGFITADNHVGAWAEIDGNNTGQINYLAELYTNDGDDTFTRQYQGASKAAATQETVAFAAHNGCVGIYDDQDDDWHWYEARAVAGYAYTPAHAFVEFVRHSSSPWDTIYLAGIKLTYLKEQA